MKIESEKLNEVKTLFQIENLFNFSDTFITELEDAYLRLSLRWHPDRQSKLNATEKNRAQQTYAEINQYYFILKNIDTRLDFYLSQSPVAELWIKEGENKNVSADLMEIADQYFELQDAEGVEASELRDALITSIVDKQKTLSTYQNVLVEKIRWSSELTDDDIQNIRSLRQNFNKKNYLKSLLKNLNYV